MEIGSIFSILLELKRTQLYILKTISTAVRTPHSSRVQVKGRVFCLASVNDKDFAWFTTVRERPEYLEVDIVSVSACLHPEDGPSHNLTCASDWFKLRVLHAAHCLNLWLQTLEQVFLFAANLSNL